MSQPTIKNPKNVVGPWYCTAPSSTEGDGCISCAVCYSNAPDFYMADENGNAYVYKQPQTEDEIALCDEQLQSCPVNSIGRNG